MVLSELIDSVFKGGSFFLAHLIEKEYVILSYYTFVYVINTKKKVIQLLSRALKNCVIAQGIVIEEGRGREK